MSTTCTAACTTFFDFDISASASSRLSGTWATPTFGSFVAKAYGRGEGATAGEGVVEGGLARVGEADEAEAFHAGREGYGEPRASKASPLRRCTVHSSIAAAPMAR